MLCGASFTRREAYVTMRSLLILVAICFSASAFAQSAAPSRNKSVVQAKPKEPSGCKLVGTVRGTKLWAGDCVGVELLKGTHTLPEQGTSVSHPIKKSEIASVYERPWSTNSNGACKTPQMDRRKRPSC